MLLEGADDGYAAAHTLGYLRTPDSPQPLLAYLARVGWGDWVALYALLRIGTEDAMAALEGAINHVGAFLTQQRAAECAAHEAGDEERKEQIHASWKPLYFALQELRLVGFQHSEPSRVVPLLIRMLASPHFDVGHVAMKSLQLLGALEHLHSMDELPVETFREIMDLIGGFGARPSVDLLLSLLQDEQLSPGAMSYVIQALGASHDKRALSPLVNLVRGRHQLLAAIPALGDLGQPQAAAALLEVMEGAVAPPDMGGWWIVHRQAAVLALGRLRLPETFEPVARFLRKHPPMAMSDTYLALVWIGAERAIPPLCSYWQNAPDTRRQVLVALIALGTPEAATCIAELVRTPLQEHLPTLLDACRDFQTMENLQRYRPHLQSEHYTGLIGEWWDGQDPVVADPKIIRAALHTLSEIASPAALALLARCAAGAHADICLSDSGSETIGDYALWCLRQAHSPLAIDSVLDELSTHDVRHVSFWLAKMDHSAVASVVQHRLTGAGEAHLAQLVTLLGWFGDTGTLPIVRGYLDHPDAIVANAAYEAEQQLLGLPFPP